MLFSNGVDISRNHSNDTHVSFNCPIDEVARDIIILKCMSVNATIRVWRWAALGLGFNSLRYLAKLSLEILDILSYGFFYTSTSDILTINGAVSN